MYSLSEVFKTLRAQGLSGLAESSRWAFEMQRASYKTHCDSLFSWWKKGKEKKRKKKKKNVTRLSEASRADNKQNSSLWVSLEMWEAFKTFLKLSGKGKKKSLLKGCSSLFYCGLFISGEKAVTRRSPTDHQPCQGLPGFGGRTLVWGTCWETVGPPLAKRGKAAGSSAFLQKRQPQYNTRAWCSGLSGHNSTNPVWMNGWLNQPANHTNRALKRLPHFGRPNKCAPYLWPLSIVSSDTCASTRVLRPPMTSPALWGYGGLSAFLSLSSADDIFLHGTWLTLSLLTPAPASILGMSTPTRTIRIPGFSTPVSFTAPAEVHRSMATLSIWPAPRISSPQKSHLPTRTFILASVPLPHSHGICFLTLFRPSILGPFLI